MITAEQKLELKLKSKCKRCKSGYTCFHEKFTTTGVIKHYKCDCPDAEVLKKVVKF